MLYGFSPLVAKARLSHMDDHRPQTLHGESVLHNDLHSYGSSCALSMYPDRDWRRLLEGEVGWRAVWEARESAGRLSDAARHMQVVGVAHGGGDRQVGELGVKVPEVGGTRLQNKNKTKTGYF